jgi:hypothetical protein
MAPSPSRTSHLRPWLGVVIVSATLLVPAASAQAGWRISSNTLIEYRDVCRDGISFGGAVRATADPGSGSYENRAIVVQPAPTNWEDWRNQKIGQVMDSPISIPRKKDSIRVEDQDDLIDVAHEGDFRMRYQTGPLDIPEVDPQPLVLNLENGADGSGVVTADVTDCYLYAAIDVQPGKSSNKVPIGHGDVSVAALGVKDVLNAAALTPGDFRFGPAKAKAKASELRDVNGDDQDDLVLRFSSKKAGLKCSTKTAVLTGKTPTGGSYQGTDKVKPTTC